jgi:hypothetical protein
MDQRFGSGDKRNLMALTLHSTVGFFKQTRR